LAGFAGCLAGTTLFFELGAIYGYLDQPDGSSSIT